MSKSAPEKPDCWCYRLSSGWEVFAGKTAGDNDLLSLSFARPEDYWFHVHNLPGSHVILRGPEGQSPGRELLEKAAAAAAWHSKARQHSSCQVDCTRAANVSKPRGAPAGTVSVTHIRRLKVKPELPAPPPATPSA